MQTYGDYFSPNTVAGAGRDGAALSRSAIPRIELADNRWVDLIHIPADVLADEYPLTVIAYRPDGRLAPRLYTQRELEQVAELEAGDPGLLDHGSEWRQLASQRPAARGTLDATEEKKEEGNSLQTELEVKLATDPKLIEAVKSEFTKITLEKCSEQNFEPLKVSAEFPIPGGLKAPAVVVVTNCSLGFRTSTTFFLPIKITLPGFEFNGVRKFCTTSFRFEDTRDFLFKEKQKSTKINFQLGVDIAKLPNLPPGISLPQGGSLTPKEGDPAFKDNKPLQQPDASGKLVGVKFDFGMIRQYVKVTVNEMRRVLAEQPKTECFEL